MTRAKNPVSSKERIITGYTMIMRFFYLANYLLPGLSGNQQLSLNLNLQLLPAMRTDKRASVPV